MTIPGSTRQTRRDFLTRALGVAVAALLPASIAEAALVHHRGRRSQRGHRIITRSHRGRTRHRAGRTWAQLRRSPRRAAGGHEPLGEIASLLNPEYRSLSMYNLHTGECVAVDYFFNGQYDRECLDEINWLLRDRWTDEVLPIDPGVLDLVHAIRNALESQEAVRIVCGYRSPATNAIMFLTQYGVAEHSYHVTGQAIDFYVPHRSLRAAHRVAMALRSGGVGYYPRSHFIHVDTGPIRYW